MIRKYIGTVHGKISYLEGDGTVPIFFLHGFGGTGNTWLKMAPYLDPGIKAVLVDLLGHGHSDKPEINYSIETQAESVLELINSFSAAKFSIVGNSYGGWIALKLASKYISPEHLFLIDSAGISPALSEDSNFKASDVIDSIMKARNYKNRDALESIMENNKRPEEKITDDELASIKSKTTIIWGDKDNILSPVYGEKLNQKINGSRLIIINNAGHTPFISNPYQVAEIINNEVLH
ncbi:MAG: alpha/beta hydrolase [Ferroplasma sp.]